MTDAPDPTPADAPQSPTPEPAPPGPPPKSFARRHWGKLTVLAFVGAPAIVFTIWTVIGLNFAYSTGERAGFVQKISRKGWLCKTWEGELAISTIPGSMPILWTFSVREDSVADAIEGTNGKRVVLVYEEKPWVPTTCFGDTKYFVTGVRVVGSAPEPM
jgi:hypothetical protein